MQTRRHPNAPAFATILAIGIAAFGPARAEEDSVPPVATEIAPVAPASGLPIEPGSEPAAAATPAVASTDVVPAESSPHSSSESDLPVDATVPAPTVSDAVERPAVEPASVDAVSVDPTTQTDAPVGTPDRFGVVPLLPAPVERYATTRASTASSVGDIELPAGMRFDLRGDLVETGFASWYGDEFAGRLTASGEIYDPAGLTVAHLTFPLGSLVEVRNLDNGRRTFARVNDRGPYVERRTLDCSLGAARVLGFVGRGVARVEVRLLDADAKVFAILARRPRPLVEDAAPPVPLVQAAPDHLAFVGPPRPIAGIAPTSSASDRDSGSDSVLRHASVLPFPALVHAGRWLAQALVGNRGGEGTAGQVRRLLDASGSRGFVRLFMR